MCDLQETTPLTNLALVPRDAAEEQLTWVLLDLYKPPKVIMKTKRWQKADVSHCSGKFLTLTSFQI